MKNSIELGTKRKFAYEALKLFSEKGYEAVSVAQIADAVGCTPPALYKHFKSKQDLFDAILEESEKQFAEHMKNMQFSFGSTEEMERFFSLTEEEEIKTVQNVVKEAIHNEFIQSFRKLLAVEQFHMPVLAKMYTDRYITYHYDRHEAIFKVLMEKGRMKKADPRVLARMYMSVPILAIGVCDREPEREEECMKMIENHIREFNNSYRVM